jgi:hypothetical protein
LHSFAARCSGPCVLSSPCTTAQATGRAVAPLSAPAGERWGALTNGVICEGGRGSVRPKTGPICISIWLLEPCAHGAGLTVWCRTLPLAEEVSDASGITLTMRFRCRRGPVRNRALTSFSWQLSSSQLSSLPSPSCLPSSLSSPCRPRAFRAW